MSLWGVVSLISSQPTVPKNHDPNDKWWLNQVFGRDKVCSFLPGFAPVNPQCKHKVTLNLNSLYLFK